MPSDWTWHILEYSSIYLYGWFLFMTIIVVFCSHNNCWIKSFLKIFNVLMEFIFSDESTVIWLRGNTEYNFLVNYHQCIQCFYNFLHCYFMLISDEAWQYSAVFKWRSSIWQHNFTWPSPYKPRSVRIDHKQRTRWHISHRTTRWFIHKFNWYLYLRSINSSWYRTLFWI